MKITYTAKRNLIQGHTAGIEYELDCELLEFNPSEKIEKFESTTISGITESLLSRIDERWSLKVYAIDSQSRMQWREFFASVAASEEFIVEEDEMELTVTLDGQYRYERIEATEDFNISFSILVKNA